MGKKSKVMTTILFIKQSLELHDQFIQSSERLNLLCKGTILFNWIFAHLASILIKDIYQYTLSCYCHRRTPIFRSFFTPRTRKSVCPPLATSDHRHVDKLTSRPRTQASERNWRHAWRAKGFYNKKRLKESHTHTQSYPSATFPFCCCYFVYMCHELAIDH